MNVGIVGLGSMGKRRIRLLKKLDVQLDLVGIDSREDRRNEAKELYDIVVEDDFRNAIHKHHFDAVIVSTSPLSHNTLIQIALEEGCHVFTELNLVKDGYERNIELAKEKDLVLFLSSTQLYRKEIQYIRNLVSEQTLPVNYIYHVGQYLPTWHSWENYKDFFVRDKRTNGCRELFAIELPWLIDVFGQIEDYTVMKGNMTTLEIDYPDDYVAMVRHEGGHIGSLNFNVVSAKAVRNLEVYGQNVHLEWKGTPDTLYQYDIGTMQTEKVSLYGEYTTQNKQNRTVIEDAYEKELEKFFEVIKGDSQPLYSFEKDLSVLELIDNFEQGL